MKSVKDPVWRPETKYKVDEKIVDSARTDARLTLLPVSMVCVDLRRMVLGKLWEDEYK